MEFPEACLTNALKIGGLSQIPYHVYIPTTRRPNPAYESTNQPNLISLRRGEAHLREKGILGTSDFTNGELWVFDVDAGVFNVPSPGPSGDSIMVETDGRQFSRDKIQKRKPEFPAYWGLRETREGLFLASSIASKEEPPKNQPTIIDLTGNDMDESPMPEYPTLSSQNDSPHIIYQHFITSVLAALSYNVAKAVNGGKRYIPLNIRTLVQVPEKRTPVSTSPTHNDFPLPAPISSVGMLTPANGYHCTRNGLIMFALTVYLTSAGTLCIIPAGRKGSGIQCLASFLQGEGENAVFGKDVWIAPWGGVGRVSELVSSNSLSLNAMKTHEKRWAEEVKQYLRERGIEISLEEDEWVRVAVWLPEEGQEERLQTIIWPTALCFIRLSQEDFSKQSTISGNQVSSAATPMYSGLSHPTTPSAGAIKPGRQDLDGDKSMLSNEHPMENESSSMRGLRSPYSSDKFNQTAKPSDSGLKWFTRMADPVDFAEKWKAGAEQRKEAIRARKDERERAKRRTLEAHALKQKAKELAVNDKDTEKTPESVKPAESTAVPNSGTGVYSTPPDGQPPTALQNAEGVQDDVAEQEPVIPMDGNSIIDNDMMDWQEGEGPMGLGGADSVQKGSGQEEIALDFLGDDLVPDDDDIFATEVTDKDFEFFDEPVFEDTLDGGIGLGEMSHVGDVSSHSLGPEDLQDLSVSDLMGMGNDSQQMENLPNLNLAGMDRSTGTTGLDMSIITPVVTKSEIPSSSPAIHIDGPTRLTDVAEIEKHVQTPPLSPHRAMRLLLPQYASNERHIEPTTQSKTSFTNNPTNNQFSNLEEVERSFKRRPSLYSPLVFLPGIEMADKKYMEGGRFFGPPPKQEKVEDKLASISLLDSPLKRRLSAKSNRLGTTLVISDQAHLSRPPELAIEDVDMRPGDEDRDGDEEDSEVDEDDDDDDLGSSESDADEDSDMEFSQAAAIAVSPAFRTGGKRKRTVDDDGELALTESGRGIATPQPGIQHAIGDDYAQFELIPPPWQTMVPDPNDYALVDVFERPTVGNSSRNDISLLNKVSDGEYLIISKILVDQVISGLLLSSQRSEGLDRLVLDEETEEEGHLKHRRTGGGNRVGEAVKETFSWATPCTLETYACIPDTTIEPTPPPPGRPNLRPIAQPRRSGKHPLSSTQSFGFDGSPSAHSSIFKIAPSHVHVHRGEMALEILPVALKFWETFGFGPCSGPKNVIAFCLYPAGDAMTEAADEFMERLGAAYDACKLGSYVRGNLDDISGGLVGIPKISREPDVDFIMQSIKDTCKRLGSSLVNVADELQNIVIYFVNPFSSPSALPDICHAFAQLQQAYVSAMVEYKNAVPNNTVLQIVPIDLIAIPHGLVTASQAEYVRYALEVYNRCIPTDNSLSSSEEVGNNRFPLLSSLSWFLQILLAKASTLAPQPVISSFRERTRKLVEQAVYSPSIVLAKPPPKSINFQLTAEPTPALLQEGACLHVAYKQSLDERWAVFAWTDNWGEIQFTETYCLGRKGCVSLKPWEEVARDAWRKTIDCMRKRNVSWRLCFTKVGGWVDEEEVELWSTLSAESTGTQPSTPSQNPSTSQNSTQQNSPSLTFLITDPSPALSIVPNLPPIIPSTFNPQSSLFTPVSTPQPSTVSPDPSGSAMMTSTSTAANVGTPNSNADGVPLESDPDACLVDYADEVWGVVMGHSLSVAQSAIQMRSSLASGFLVRRGVGRGGIEGAAEVGVVGVHLVSLPDGPVPNGGNGNGGNALAVRSGSIGGGPLLGTTGGGKREITVLKEVLGQYRGLMTLAQHKGVTSDYSCDGVPGRTALPWHAAVVDKAVEALERCM